MHDHMAYKTISDHTEPYWNLQDHLGPYRTIQEHTGPHGLKWDPSSGQCVVIMNSYIVDEGIEVDEKDKANISTAAGK